MSERLSVAEYLKNHYDADIKEILPDGRVKIFANNPALKGEKEMTIDPKVLLDNDAAATGVDIDHSKIEMSSPDYAIRESRLSFLDQYKLARAPTERDQYRFLKEQFGEDRVKLNSNNEIVVKDEEGIWSRAGVNSGLTSLLSTEGGSIAGMVAGAKIGAGFGSAVPGVGTLIGAALGSGLGGVIGKIATIGDAYAAGIRTELDAQEISKELFKDFVLGASGDLLAGGVAKVIGKGAKSNKALIKIAKSTDSMPPPKSAAGEAGYNSWLREKMQNEALRDRFAGAASSMTTRPKDEARFILDYPDLYGKYSPKAIAFEESGKKALGAINPVLNEGDTILTNALNRAKEVQQAQHGAMKRLLDPVFDNVHITADELEKSTGILKFLQDRSIAASPAERALHNQLKSKIGLISQEGGLLLRDKAFPLSRVQDLVSTIQERLASKAEIVGNTYQGVAKQLNASLKNVISRTLNDKHVKIPIKDIPGIKKALGKNSTILELVQESDPSVLNKMHRELHFLGKTPRDKAYRAGDLYNSMNQVYAQRSSWFQTLNRTGKAERMQAFTEAMVSGDKALAQQDLINLLTDTGQNGAEIVKDLYARHTAVSWSPWLAESRKTSNPLTMGAQQAFGYLGSSPQKAGKYLKWLGEREFMQLKANGLLVDGISKMPKGQALKALPSLEEAAYGAVQQQQQMTRQLIEQGKQAVQGGR